MHLFSLVYNYESPSNKSIDSTEKKELIAWLPNTSAPPPSAAESSMDIDTISPISSPQKTSAFPSNPLPESEVYLRLLILHDVISSSSPKKTAFNLAHQTIEKIQRWNRRSMDPLAARIYFALGRAYELAGELEVIRP